MRLKKWLLFRDWKLPRPVTLSTTSCPDQHSSSFARAVVQIAVLSDDTDSFCNIQIGSRVLAEEFIPKQGLDFPTVPDDFFYTGGALPGDRLVVRVRNADAAAAINFWVLVIVTEV